MNLLSQKYFRLIDIKIFITTEYKEYDTIACDYDYNLLRMDMEIDCLKNIYSLETMQHLGRRDSFNKQGSQDILDRFQLQEKLIDIPSVHMAKMRFNKSLFSKFTGTFRDNIVFTAFMLAFGRMSPTHPVNKFAEGLINPNVGRGVNYSSVMKMGFELQGINIDELVKRCAR